VLVFRDDHSEPRGLLKKLSENGAKLVIVVDPTGRLARVATRIRLTSPNEDPKLPAGRWLFVPSFPETLSPEARITVKAKPLSVRALRASNVAGILRGDDPKLRETYVVVSAHYDHEGALPFGAGDRVFNGANDDASGVTGLLEIAAAIAAMPERPKRSIIFATFAGEEEGLLGSREFVRHSPVPLDKIVANLNFEHLGRPDSDGASYVGKAAATGFDFSTLGATLAEAGQAAGVDIFKHEKFSDPFFAASDNYSFAVAGIPSLTVCHGFIFPEYHALGDHWEKINVDSMTQVLRALAMGALRIADDAVAPQWSETNEKASKFRESSRR
jgi:Zn-dependent M28 family amino/carboxypeptidase